MKVLIKIDSSVLVIYSLSETVISHNLLKVPI